MKHYLVYKITNNLNGKIYIGVHTTNNIEDGYMGSGIGINRAIKKYGVENFTKEILHECKNLDDMLSKEKELVNKDFIHRHDTYNQALGGGKIFSGVVCVKDKNGNFLFVDKTDPKYLSGELKFVSTGMVNVKDKDGNGYRVNKDDPRYLSGDFVHSVKGTVCVKDKNGNSFRVDNDDPRWVSGELVGVNKDKITVKNHSGDCFTIARNDPRLLTGELTSMLGGIVAKDKNGNRFQVDRNDPRWLSEELVGVNKGMVVVKDESENIFQIDKKDPRYLSGELKMNCPCGKGMMYIKNPEMGISKRIKKEDLEYWLDLKPGWVIGKFKRTKE